MIKTVGSICSGIEAASVAWKPMGVSFKWFSEIAPFPSQVLRKIPKSSKFRRYELIFLIC